jgi:hypothetical protein
MEDDRIPKPVNENTLPERRTVGRIKRRWGDKHA